MSDEDDITALRPELFNAAATTSGLPEDAAQAETTPGVGPGSERERGSTSRRLFGPRYQNLERLGAGGMGEVRLVLDHRLGREVAAKVIRTRHAGRKDVEERFVREACLQGQLEHPSIVPVYDLGLTENGEAYFTMKRVRGLALDEILRKMRAGDGSHSRRKLLTAFASVCLTVDFAHSRGVLHRDLKPSNIMLGDFGEVYVLDWGIAKVVGTGAPDEQDPTRTADGNILGTPGYMAPEQLKDTSDKLTPRTDIYALGAILFELLTLQTLHPRDSPSNTMRSTLAGADARASVRAPDREVPPELEAICVRATATDPEHRLGSAREISDAIERFLDGDRDLETRKVAALQHAQRAEKAIERAVSGLASSEHADRALALKELSHALALDPSSPGAVASMVRLMLEPPRSLPVEARAEMERVRKAAKKTAAKTGSLSTAALLAATPLLFWMGMRDLRWAWVALACTLSMAGFGAIGMRMKEPPGFGRHIVFASGLGLVLALGRMFGPLFVVPGFASMFVLPMVITAEKRERVVMAAIGAIAVLVPPALELAGVLPASYAFRDGMMCVVPQMLAFPAAATLAYLSFWAVAQVVVPTVFGWNLHAKFTEAEERLQLHAWYLKQLVPDRR